MNTSEVITLVAEALSIPVHRWRKGKGNEAVTNARYIAFGIMLEEGIAPIEAIGAIGLSRTMIGRVTEEFNGRLKVRKDFKTAYLACIARIAEMEEINEQV